MRPDLRNVVIEVEDERNSQRRVVAHHRAFPELNAEGQSPTEGLLALLGLLKRSSPSAMDDRHRLELAHAVFEVESLLKVLVSSDRLRICGYSSVITKTSDLIYFLHNMTQDDQTGLVCWNPQGSEESEEQDDTVIIYSVGRRFGDRRCSKPGQRPRSGQAERRRHEQRTMDRRQYNRLKLIDQSSGI
ncbi:MAG: hypothetical protein WBX00_36620 [Isosphaeraceae bacterium]